MAKASARKRNLIEGRPALIVIDIQAGPFNDKTETDLNFARREFELDQGRPWPAL